MTADEFKRNVLLMQKMTADSPVVNLFRQWGIVCTELPLPKMDIKDLPAHDFSGEHGEDAFIPSYIPVKPYDLTMKFAYKGDMDLYFANIFEGFIRYLVGNAPSTEDYDSITEGGFKIYDRHNCFGRQRVHFKNFDPETLVHDTSGDHLSFKITFRFTDPMTAITLIDPDIKVTL
jgi:hypothetical protein